jgi:predicted Zn-dependent protease
LAAARSPSPWTTGYSRELEGQVDRLGLRYVHEAGYNALRARFRDNYGERDKVSSIFVGTHAGSFRSHAQPSSADAANLNSFE